MSDYEAWVDQSRGVRESEKLERAALESYLKEVIPGLSGSLVIEQFPSGHSNLTYLIKVGQRELVLRRPPFGAKIKTAHDMGREHRILSGLVDVVDWVPRPLHHCEDESIIGAPFYVMERVHGVILRGMKRREGMDPALMRRLSTLLVDTLAQLHSVDLEAAGLRDLGKPQGYAERQITGWIRRYKKAQTDDLKHMEQAAAWLSARIPTETGATLIHNDFKYDNVMLEPGGLKRVVAVLDWEMATLGDPLMDLGTSLGYWFTDKDPAHMRQLPFGPTVLPGNLTRQEVVDRYAERTGRDVSNMLFYYVYALYKIAVIIQQIYARYKRGLTDDPRFAMFGVGVQFLAQACVEAIDRGTLE